MGEACNTQWSEEECMVGKPEWKRPLRNLGLDERAILKLDLHRAGGLGFDL